MLKQAAKSVTDYQLDESVPYMMNRVVGLMNRQLELDLQQLGLSFQHWRIVAVLAEHDGRSIKDLSDYAVVPHSSLSRLLTRMEEDGYVRREVDALDARNVKVHITPVGSRMYRKILPMAIGIREQALQGLGDAERRTMLKTLNRMRTNMQPD
ncbi:MAG: hypothetical protein JWQ72_136 [Polaromonas sp.]|nr:hypothetical protein [Polaromonas sp.]